MKHSRRTQAARTAATRSALIGAGRRLFSEHGFSGVGAEAIVREASVTRGALYHHFDNKTELFAAALEAIEAEVTEKLAAALSSAEGDFVDLMIRSVEAWLDACERPEVRRIVLVDGPSVLGWERWRKICQPHILGLIEGVLGQGMQGGTLIELPVKPLAHILLSVADEAALYVTAAADPGAARRDVIAIVRPLLESLTQPS